MIPVNVRAFKKLRKYIAENVPPSQIYMEDWFKAMGYDLPTPDCGTAGCIFGHGVFALLPKRERPAYTFEAVRSVGYKLGFGFEAGNATPPQLCNLRHWPYELYLRYRNGTPRQKKNAVLAILDRVIAAKGIDW
jgi:hypothetical protein